MNDSTDGVEEISIDGDSPVATRKGPRWELLLGGLVILAVVLFAGWDWWSQETLARAYMAAHAAAERREWDAAQDGYAHLGDYRDAATQARYAAQQIATRDTAWAAGSEAAAAQQWVTATAAFSTTLAIEPQFRDVKQQFAAARAALVKEALVGVIYRRAAGDTPGLYVRPAGGGELLLPGSDDRSRVWAADTAAGYIVYDAPGGDAVPTPIVPSSPADLMAGRTMRIAAVKDGAVNVVLVGATPAGGVVAVGPGGLWQWGSQRTNIVPQSVSGYVRDNLLYFDAAYPAGREVGVEGPNWGVLAVDAANGRLLLGEFVKSDLDGLPGTRLYISGPFGQGALPFYMVNGTVESANFSADGKLLIFRAHEERGTGKDEYRASLNVTDMRGTTYRTSTVTWATTKQGTQPVDGVLLPGDKLRVLLKQPDRAYTSYELRDVDGGKVTRLWEGLSPYPEVYWIAPDGQSLIVSDQRADGIYFTQVALQSGPAQNDLAALPMLPLSGSIGLADIQISGGYAVYSAASMQPDGSRIMGFYGAPLAAPDSTTVPKAKPIYQASADDPRYDPIELVLQGGLLVYVQRGEGLRLRTFDNSLDIAALPDADMVWSFGLPQMSVWRPPQ